MTYPTLAPEPDTDADATFRNWMRLNLARAAEKFGLSVTGAPVFGWRLRSIGAVAHDPNGARWLRVVSEQPQWATGEFWTGNQDANTLTGLPKPVVLASTEWDEAGWRSQRAEVMTLLPGEPCSPSDVLRTDVELSDKWYSELRRSLHRLASVPTTRITVTQTRVNGLVRAAFGQHRNPQVNRWETVHGDLHWGNLLQPRLGFSTGKCGDKVLQVPMPDLARYPGPRLAMAGPPRGNSPTLAPTADRGSARVRG
jgi:hypothetical protein